MFAELPEFATKLILAIIMGGIIGIEREMTGKSAGFRTNIMICVASTLLTIVSLNIMEYSSVVDPSRLMANIIVGIGFIGAGTIIQSKKAVIGLTTAATIWVVAAIGITIGAGYYILAFTAMLIILLTLFLLRYIEIDIIKRYSFNHYKTTIKGKKLKYENVEKTLKSLRIDPENLDFNKVGAYDYIDVYYFCSTHKNKTLFEELEEIKGVKDITQEIVLT